MELKYFKTNIWGDCYVSKENYSRIITISEENLFVMADDEGMFEGAYKILKISKKDFTNLKELAENRKRMKFVGLLKKIHKENKETLENPFVKIKMNNSTEINNPYIYQTWTKEYFEKEPILD